MTHDDERDELMFAIWNQDKGQWELVDTEEPVYIERDKPLEPRGPFWLVRPDDGVTPV